MITPAYVVDASVAVKWFSQGDEDDLEKALKLQEFHLQKACVLMAPDLLIYELINALRYNPSFNQQDLRQALQSLQKMELELVEPAGEFFERAIELAYQKDITIYDASYIALAWERKALLITADKKFYKKIQNLPQVILAQNWEY